MVQGVIAGMQEEIGQRNIVFKNGHLVEVERPGHVEAGFRQPDWQRREIHRTREKAEIEISCSETPEEFTVWVRGVGFDVQYANNLFSVFQQHRAEDFEGTGIGLANVRRIIHRHGGRTWAEGKVNEAPVYFFIAQKKGNSLSPLKRILLAEDNANDIELTLSALEEYNLANEVIVTRDGVGQLDYLYQRGKFAGQPNVIPAVILLDLKMPRMDGLETLRQLRSDARFKHVPVVMITSSRENRI